MLPLKSLFVLVFALMGGEEGQASFFGSYSPAQCIDQVVSKGSEPDSGQGIIRYCSDGKNQMIYLSGVLDTARDRRSLNAILKSIKLQSEGKVELVTYNGGGGDVKMHQRLIETIEEKCVKLCRIRTQVRGVCESACNQLHFTCVEGAETVMEAGAKLCEHASQDAEDCKRCDSKQTPPTDPKALVKFRKEHCNICERSEAIAEYTQRCEGAAQNRPNIRMNKTRVEEVRVYAEKLASEGVFDSDEFNCENDPPWVKRAEVTPAQVIPVQ